MPRKEKKSALKVVLYFIALVILVKVVISLISLSPILFQLLFNKDINLKKTQDQRVNVLLLGIGGGSHDGPNLTDTIILASVDPQKNRTTLMSIPRDLWIPDLNGKINTAYADGESKKKGGGLIEAEATVQKITGQSVDYGIRIDFGGFVKAVDTIGGLDIKVENTLDDSEYPVSGKEDDTCGLSSDQLQQLATESAEIQFDKLACRYTHIHFDKGLTHMNGTQALEYVRSRHALGDEGTDFARSRRQQIVIAAFRDKMLSAGTILSPSKMLNLYSDIKGSIDTDIKQDEYDDFIKLADKMKKAKVQSGIIDIGDDTTGRPGLLIHPDIKSQYNFEWVLVPRKGDNNFGEIQSYIACMITVDSCDFFKLSPTPAKK